MKKTLLSLLPSNMYLALRWYDFKLNKPESFAKIQALRTQDSSESGGYKCFDEAQAIFVHIPKCAGISVNKALFGSVAGGHTTLDQYINVFEPSLFKQYFKFTFVRNPWDRVVSAYSFLQKGGLNTWDKDFFERELKPYDNFEPFVKGWLNEKNIMKHHHFRPQTHYIIDKYNQVSVDYIAYFENIENDFTFISQKLGGHATLSKSNAIQRADYRAFYNKETKAIVERIYQKDIDLLNYHFDGVDSYVRKLSI